MANFIGLVYGTLKSKGIDTSKMSTEQAIAKFNELQGEDGEKSGSKSKTEVKQVNASSETLQTKPKQEKISKKLSKQEINEKYNNPTTKNIKDVLKSEGIDIKGISVREGRGGYSTSFNITVKSPYIDLDKVRKNVRGFESYETDSASGEILSGGNTFVLAQYEYGVFDEVVNENLADAQKYYKGLAKQVEEYGKNTGYEIKENVYLFQNPQDPRITELVVKRKNENGIQEQQRRNVFGEEDLSKYLFQLKQFNKLV